MALIADGLLLAAALTAAVYCHVLAGRLGRLRRMDEGVGQAVAAMASQTEELRAALRAAKTASAESTRILAERTARAEMAAGRLELLLAATHAPEGGDRSEAQVNARREAREQAAWASSRRGEPEVEEADPAGASGGLLSRFLSRKGGATEPEEGPDRAEDEPPAEEEALASPDEEEAESDGADPAEAETDAEMEDEAEATLPEGDEAGLDAPSAEPAPQPREAPPARQLFRVDAMVGGETIDETPVAAPPRPPRRGKGIPADADGTEALRAAIEALARETSE